MFNRPDRSTPKLKRGLIFRELICGGVLRAEFRPLSCRLLAPYPLETLFRVFCTERSEERKSVRLATHLREGKGLIATHLREGKVHIQFFFFFLNLSS